MKEIIRDKAERDNISTIADDITLKFFHDDAGDGGDLDDDEDIDPEGLLTISIKPRKRPLPKVIVTEGLKEEEEIISDEEAGDEGALEKTALGDQGGGHGAGEGDGTGGTGSAIERSIVDAAIEIANERFIRRSQTSGLVRFKVPNGASGSFELCLLKSVPTQFLLFEQMKSYQRILISVTREF